MGSGKTTEEATATVQAATRRGRGAGTRFHVSWEGGALRCAAGPDEREEGSERLRASQPEPGKAVGGRGSRHRPGTPRERCHVDRRRRPEPREGVLSAEGKDEPHAPSAETQGPKSYVWPARVFCEACTALFNLDLFPVCLRRVQISSLGSKMGRSGKFLDPRSCMELSSVWPPLPQLPPAGQPPAWPRLSGPCGQLSSRAWHQTLTAVAQSETATSAFSPSLTKKAHYEALSDRTTRHDL